MPLNAGINHLVRARAPRLAASDMRLSDAAHCRSRCACVRRCLLMSLQGMFLSAPQVGQGTTDISWALSAL